jgi:hypothetical protein
MKKLKVLPISNAACLLLIVLSLGSQMCRSISEEEKAPHISAQQPRFPSDKFIPPRNSGGVWIFFDGLERPALPDQSEAKIDQMRMRVETLKQYGSQYIRIWIPWSEVESEPGMFKFEKFEKIFSTIVRSGQKLQVTLASSMYPEWFWISVLQADNDKNLHWFWNDSESPPRERPETYLKGDHRYHPRKVQSPQLSIWAPPEAKNYIHRFVDKSFEILLDKWAPFILYIQLSLGRLNEPTYPSKDYFWCYDPNAIEDFQKRMKQKYVSTSSLNKSWSADYSNFTELRPPAPPFARIKRKQKTDFFEWYRDSKRRWVLEANGWVLSHLKSRQKNLFYVAGASGDIEFNSKSKTYLEAAPDWNWDNSQEGVKAKNALRHMQDNFWIIRTSKDLNWYIQYAGVSGLDPDGKLFRCDENPVCREVPRYAEKIGYKGPIYAQIADLRPGIDQPERVGEQIYKYHHRYHGLHWNRDDNLFGPRQESRLLSLKKAWENIQEYYGTDHEGPEFLQIAEQRLGASLQISWTVRK